MAEIITDKVILGLIGAAFSLILAVSSYFIKEYLSSLQTRLALASKELAEFRIAAIAAVNSVKSELQTFDRKWSEVHIREGAKFDALSTQVNSYNKDMSKLEGRLEEHMQLLASQISTNRAINDKLVRIFGYIDAKERATDAAQPK